MKNPLIEVIKIPAFFFLLLSEFFSQFAMNLLSFIILIVVFNISKSNIAVAGVILSFTLPSVAFGILAGAYVDKWDKKKVLITTNALRALAVFPLIFVSTELLFIYLLCFLVSVITQFFIPAETPMIPHLVKRDQLLSANALFSMGIFGSIIAGYALSGPLLLLLGQVNVFVLLTSLFVISAFFAFIIKYEFSKDVKTKVNIAQEARGVLFLTIKNKKIYHSLILLTFLQTLILVIAVIGPGYATDILRIKVEEFPLLFVTPAVVGMAIGAVIIGNFLHSKSKEILAKIGLLTIGIIVLVFPYGHLLTPYIPYINLVHIMIILAVIIGFAFSLVFVPSNTILQEETTDEQRGKIYGLLNTMVGAISLAPVLAVGFIADVLGVGQVVTIIGITIIFAALLRIFKYK